MKCGPPAKAQELEGIYGGCLLAGQNRNLSPATKKILGLLARQAKIALDHGQTNYDREAFLQEVEDIDTIKTYGKKREADGKKLQRYDVFSKMGDYASVLCKQLKEVKGARFKDMFWIQVVEKLDEEIAGHTQWLNDGSIGDEPAKPLHRELERTMRVVEEEDYEQGFWEIRQYACRNWLMHSGILDERICGEYEEVLQHIQADLESLDRSLPADQLANVDKYRTMISRFRSRWFVPKSVDRRNQVTWKPNAEAKKHLDELKGPKVYDHSENDIGQLHKTISELTKELKDVKDIMKSNEKLVSSTRRIALASLEVAANAVPSLAVIDDLTP